MASESPPCANERPFPVSQTSSSFMELVRFGELDLYEVDTALEPGAALPRQMIPAFQVSTRLRCSSFMMTGRRAHHKCKLARGPEYEPTVEECPCH